MPVAVDTNIVLDVLLAGPAFLKASKQLLITYIYQNLVISEVVYAELATAFPEHTKLEEFLQDTQITLTITR